MEYREIIDCCYRGNGLEKLGQATSLFSEYGEDLLGDPAVSKLLKEVSEAAMSLETHMLLMDMGKGCAACAATGTGGCCSAYMGNENSDVLQILMNLLVGVEVTAKTSDGIECCFLGKEGCAFLLKPIFCLNYLCHRIQKESDVAALTVLEKKTGILLQAQVELEQQLIGFLQQNQGKG